MSLLSNNIAIYFKGAAGNQFKRNVYTTMVPFKSLDRFFRVFPEVQRKVNKKRVKEIAKYIIKGAQGSNLCFLSAITATCRGDIEYDETKNAIGIDIDASLSINDGQHRAEGIKLALNNIRNKLEKCTDLVEQEKLKGILKNIEQMTIPVVIFSNMNKMQEQQLFHDLNLLAAKPSKSIALKFDNTDLYNLLANDLSTTNEFLIKYGIEVEKTQLRANNCKLMVFSTLRNFICYILSGVDNDTQNKLNEDNYDEMKVLVNEILNELFIALPKDCNDREKYIIGTAATIQGIGKYINYLMENEELIDWKQYISNLKNIDWSHKSSVWTGFGGSYIQEKNKFVFTGTSAGINGVYNALINSNKIV